MNSFISDVLIQKIIIPIGIACLTWIVFRLLDEWKKRRDQSILGIAIIDALIEEVQTGISIIRQTETDTVNVGRRVPVKSWDGMKTIPDEILLRIIAISRSVKPVSFPPYQIRTHCKNYFDHMATSWDLAMSDKNEWKARTTYLIKEGKFLEAANGVLQMLQQCRTLLEKNSKARFPK
ncbi:MAG: hypothetical protein JNK14_02300 [Chitinophagaceae bacterium]|nr:hypothetical protein [Chitinophagaceae bacterium]